MKKFCTESSKAAETGTEELNSQSLERMPLVGEKPKQRSERPRMQVPFVGLWVING